MGCIKIGTAALISFSLLGASAQAATFCTAPDEMAALRTAAMQQELMVAGLTCHAMDAYNRFVLAYRPELQKSDADLKTYFIKRNGMRGEADYDTFKTKLANLSSLSYLANSTGYCASSRFAFDMALRGRQSLASFVAEHRLMIALPEQQLCAPVTTAGVEPAQPRRFAAVAPAQIPPAQEAPASPYGAMMGTPRNRVAPPPPLPSQQNYDSQDNDEDYDDDEDAAPIPPVFQRPVRPPVIQAQGPAYGGAGWGPPPVPRGYGPDRPYYYYGR